MSSTSSTIAPRLLHLIKHIGERRLQLEGLFDLVGAHIWVFSVFEKARTLMLADELDERGHVGFPILGESLKVFKHRIDSGRLEESHSVFGIFVEVGIKNALVHEIGLLVDIKENPT